MITITHTHAGGTLVEGTSRGDGTNTVLKAHRFRWSRSLGCWYLPHSRDEDAQLPTINAAAEALRATGHQVEISIDESVARSGAEIETDSAERAAARAVRYEARAGRAAERLEQLNRRAGEIAEGIAYWQNVIATAEAAGVKVWSRADFVTGDYVNHGANDSR